MELPDYLPLSMLNQLEYCPRRFWYMFVEAEMVVNEHVLEGTFQHERAHEAGVEREGEDITLRRVYVYSHRLRLTGFVDLLEEREGEWAPVEYKKGRMGRWTNDEVQLCAQALCLEEQMGPPIRHGYVFYFGSRRRQEVVFTPELRRRTEASVARAFDLMREGQIPPPLPAKLQRKCRDCSLEPVCLPAEVQALQTVGVDDASRGGE